MTNEAYHYLTCALWSSTGDDDAPLDDSFTPEDVSADSVAKAERDLKEFRAKAGNLLDGIDAEQFAHDLWLTRNGHGAGFWDRGYPEAIGDALTELAHAMGEVYAYVGDDGQIHFD